MQPGGGARTVQDQLDMLYHGIVNVCDPQYAGGADATGVGDSTAAFKAAVAELTPGKTLYVPFGVKYRLTDTIKIWGAPRTNFQFNAQLLDFSGMAGAPKPGLHFRGISQSCIDDIFVIGHTVNVSVGVYFDADAANISIHCNIGKIYAANCNMGVLYGSSLGWQLDDWYVQDTYASDCVRGIVITGENTLAMAFGRVAAYHCTSIGVHIEQGSGSIQSLQVADAPTNIYFGQTDGKNHNKLNRWDITAGYSEEGQPGEVFIASAACTDNKPFREQIVIAGARCTPFSVTEVEDFVRWRLNGDIIFRNMTFTCGTQLPYFSLDHNPAYRAPNLVIDDCIFDVNPPGDPDLAHSFKLSDNRQSVEIRARVNNAASAWNNGGAAGFGVIARGIDTGKRMGFQQALQAIGGLAGAWNLMDVSSSKCKNMVRGGPLLTVSASVERRDVWMDDGLIGVLAANTAVKDLTAPADAYAVPQQLTFGCILRPTVGGSQEENATNFGGAGAMRISMYDAGGGVAICLVGGANAVVALDHPYDAHLIIGRYVSATSVMVDAVNLRTGQIKHAANLVGVPATQDVAWNSIISMRTSHTARAFPFFYGKAISSDEVSTLAQAALMLTETWAG